MQLWYYLAIVRRFWWLVLFLPLAVGALSLAVALAQPPAYVAAARLMVTQTPFAPDATATLPDVNLNYSWDSSEFILDDLPQVIASAVFAADVATELQARGVTVAPSVVQAGLSAEIFHRSVSLRAVAGDPDTALAIASAAISVLREHGLQYWGRDLAGAPGLSVAVLDPPAAAQASGGLRDVAQDVVLRSGLAFALAVGLAFLLHYLDNRLRYPQQAEEWTGATIVGMIPRE